MNVDIVSEHRSSTAILEYCGGEAALEWSAWSSLICQAFTARGEAVNQDATAALGVWLSQAHCACGDLSNWAGDWSQARRSYSFTAQIEQQIEHMLLWLHDDEVALPHPDSVTNYVREHSDMCVSIEIMATTCRGHFGKDAHLILDLYRDPEEGDDQYLFLCVRAHDYGADFTRLVDRIRDFGDTLLGKNAGLLLVSTDFAPIE